MRQVVGKMTEQNTISINKNRIIDRLPLIGKQARKKRGNRPLSEGLNFTGADFPLIIVTTLLVVFGVVMVFSASYYNSINDYGTPYSYLRSQGLYAISGFVLMYVASRINYKFWKRMALPLAVVGVLMLFLIFTPLGVTVNGATRWLNLILFTVMPGEITKLVIIILCATYFSRDMKRAENLLGILPIVIYTVVCCLLIVKQPNLSTAITVFLIAVGIAFVAGLQWRYIVLMFVGIGGGTFYLLNIDKGYWHDRMASFLDPFADALGDGFQVVQSLLALGTGGLTGKGLGQSIQKNLYLPEPQNDFILAIIGEELGFIGIGILLIIFAIMVWRIFYISLQAKDNFGMLLGSGVGIMIGVQVILNVAVVTSSMPPTGIALPFISAGGNALWIFMGLVGIVLNISRTINDDAIKEERI